MVQYRETNMAVTVDVRVDWNVVSCEHYLGGREEGAREGRERGREEGFQLSVYEQLANMC